MRRVQAPKSQGPLSRFHADNDAGEVYRPHVPQQCARVLS